MKRATTVPAMDSTCNDKRLNYKTKADFDRFLKGQLQGNLDAISGFTGAQIQTLKNSKNVSQNAQYNKAISNLQVAENIVNSYIKCINKDILQRNDYSSKIYTMQQEVESVRKEAEAKKETVKEAKERAAQLENPYNTTSRWESWFPLGRPIQKENVPVLISISIVMLIFSLGIFLRFAGMELRFESLQTSTNSFLKNINSGKYPYRG
jgi:hypothetical protein